MTEKIRAGKWHHGASNTLECLGCDLDEGPLDDRRALREARKHVRETGHTVMRGVERFQEIRLVRA